MSEKGAQEHMNDHELLGDSKYLSHKCAHTNLNFEARYFFALNIIDMVRDLCLGLAKPEKIVLFSFIFMTL